MVAPTPGDHIVIDRGVKNMGETYTSSGICHDGKSPAFWAKHDSESAERFARSIALRNPCSAQARGIRSLYTRRTHAFDPRTDLRGRPAAGPVHRYA
jgi:hypothetical protein